MNTKPIFSVIGWDTEQYRRTDAYTHQIALFFQSAVQEAARISVGLPYDIRSKKPFSFSDYPQTSQRVSELFRSLASGIQTTINQGTSSAWELGNLKNDALVDSILPTSALSAVTLSKFRAPNLEALAAFQNRKRDGLDLSGRVSGYTDQSKNEIELALEMSLGQGKSAAQVARSLQGYLNDPDKLFRRVRDKSGSLSLSKAAKLYNPGQGVYRSSFKNAERLARTEINMAYRESDYLRWQGLDFVVGIEVRRSNNPYPCPICPSLAGKYPKDFKFVGWHPNCRCHAISILATPDELAELNRKLLTGEDVGDFRSVNTVDEPHQGWNDWVNDNRSRLLAAKTTPYFIRDNLTQAQLQGGLPTGGQNTPLHVPDTLATYETTLGITVDRRIFSMLSEDIPLRHIGTDAYYAPVDKYVTIPINARRKNSTWGAESVVYHEYGHAIDHNRGLSQRQEVSKLMEKYRKKFGKGDKYGNIDILYQQYDRELFQQNRKAQLAGDWNTVEKISGARDTLMALNLRYGYGHPESYFRTVGMPEAEVIAHAFENHFIGNPIFQAVMPDLYADMTKLVEKWVKEFRPKP